MAKTSKKSASKSKKKAVKVSGPKAVAVSPKESTSAFKRLRRWNGFIAVLLVAEAVAITMLSQKTTLPLTTNYLNADSLASQAAGHQVDTALA